MALITPWRVKMRFQKFRLFSCCAFTWQKPEFLWFLINSSPAKLNPSKVVIELLEIFLAL